MVEYTVVAPTIISLVKHKLITLQIKGDGDRQLWSEVGRASSERKPTRMLHRCFDMMQKTMEATMQEGLSKDTRLLLIRDGDKVVASISSTAVIWTEHAKSKFAAQDLAMAKSYAEMP